MCMYVQRDKDTHVHTLEERAVEVRTYAYTHTHTLLVITKINLKLVTLLVVETSTGKFTTWTILAIVVVLP